MSKIFYTSSDGNIYSKNLTKTVSITKTNKETQTYQEEYVNDLLDINSDFDNINDEKMFLDAVKYYINNNNLTFNNNPKTIYDNKLNKIYLLLHEKIIWKPKILNCMISENSTSCIEKNLLNINIKILNKINKLPIIIYPFEKSQFRWFIDKNIKFLIKSGSIICYGLCKVIENSLNYYIEIYKLESLNGCQLVIESLNEPYELIYKEQN